MTKSKTDFQGCLRAVNRGFEKPNLEFYLEKGAVIFKSLSSSSNFRLSFRHWRGKNRVLDRKSKEKEERIRFGGSFQRVLFFSIYLLPV
jgi:hypothetical protein